MGKTLRYGEFKFPSKKGFTGSAADGPVTVRGHTRTRTKRVRMADGGTPPSVVPALRPLVEHGEAPFGGGPGIGSGSMAETDRMVEAARRGYAPLTVGGIAAALSNATAITDPVKMGLATGLEKALGVDAGLLGGVQNIPGHQTFDLSVVNDIKAGKIRTMSEAIKRDNVIKGGSSTGMGGNPGGADHPGMGSNTPSGRDKPGPGGIVRAKGGRVTAPAARKIAKAEVKRHDVDPHAHGMAKGGRARRGVPTFNRKPVIG